MAVSESTGRSGAGIGSRSTSVVRRRLGALENAVLGDPSSISPLARWLLVCIVAAGVFAGLVSLVEAGRSLLPPGLDHKDFVQEYLLARAIADGVDPYLPISTLASRYLGYVPSTVFPHPSPHPIPAGLLAIPIAWLPFPTAAAVWFAIELACLFGCAAVLLPKVGKWPRGVAVGVLGLAIASWHPFRDELVWGQVMIPMLLLLLLARRAIRRDRSLAGGLFLGLAFLLKPMLWPLALWLLLRRQMRTLVGFGLTSVFGYAVSGMIVGFNGLAKYFTSVVPAVTKLYQSSSWNISLWTIPARLFAGTGSIDVSSLTAPPLAVRPDLTSWLPPMLLTVALGASLLLTHHTQDFDASLGIMLCACILMSPVSWIHYSVLLVMPIATLSKSLLRRALPIKPTAVAGATALLLSVPVSVWRAVAILVGHPQADPNPTYVSFAASLISMAPTLALVLLVALLATTASRHGLRLGREDAIPSSQ